MMTARPDPADDPAQPASLPARVLRVGAQGTSASARVLPQEAPIALVHDATTTAVMMATPADVADLAVGFTLTEGIVADQGEIAGLEIVATELGIEARIWLNHARAAQLAARRRHMAGPTGCGLCGVDSLGEALRRSPLVPEGLRITPVQVHAAVDALAAAQRLGEVTRAVHAAAWWSLDDGLVAIREDVGRHNALDKLAGALARRDAGSQGGAPGGVLVLTSRVSLEMAQKAAMIGAQVVIAVSAPTALAVQVARRAGITLIGVARQDGFEVFTREDRLDLT